MNKVMGLPYQPEQQALSSGVRHGAAALIAVLGHAGLAWLAMHSEAPPSVPPPGVTEVMLVPPAPPPPVRLPEPAEPKPPEPQAEAPKPARAHTPSAPREVARAAPLLTAPERTKEPDEPVRFVTDPNGTAFGFGVVARGGTAKEGLGNDTPKATLAPMAQEGNSDAPFRGELGRAPRLTAFDPCRGYFPGSAQTDRGDATVRVTVDKDGSVRRVAVLAEQPLAQGFGAAARACLLGVRFEPALDRGGRAVVAIAPITVRFSR